ncbi:MAG: TraR/DksA C4-type zinc finger protein [Actinomycetota bacterium]|nr:TraR/DksA C4-type zinc finger protein [Actinomycetota bacterium]
MVNSQINEQFVQEQEQRLEETKAELERMGAGAEAGEAEGSPDEGDQTEHDSGDGGQQIFSREMDATIGNTVASRLEDVEKALEKIEAGTYGICEDTGEEIPKGRLEVMPEAIRTVEAQQSFERERRPPTS